MSSIPDVPTAQTWPATRRLDGRKARRKHYQVEVLTPRMAKGRMPRQAFGKHMPYVESVTMGDRVFDQGPITDPRNDPYLRR